MGEWLRDMGMFPFPLPFLLPGDSVDLMGVWSRRWLLSVGTDLMVFPELAPLVFEDKTFGEGLLSVVIPLFIALKDAGERARFGASTMRLLVDCRYRNLAAGDEEN